MVLIVDDKSENLYSLKKVLELNNFNVDTAESGEEALKKVLRNTYFLIILDVQMPGMDGFEVAEALQGYSKAKDIPILFLSAVNTDKRFISKGYETGAMDYVTKPVDTDILLLKVKTFYRLSTQNRELNEVQNTLRQEIEFRKQAQNELRVRLNELRSTMESIPQIAFTATHRGEIEFANKYWFEYSSSDNTFPEIHPDDGDINSIWLHSIKEGNSIEKELRLRKPGTDEYRYHLLRVIPIRESDQIVKWVGTFTDIEEQKQVEQKKDEFLSIASHELKTPLTSIKAYVQLLEKNIDKMDTGTVRNYLQRAETQLGKLSDLIADLLDISKIESGRMKFNKRRFNFETMLNSTIDLIRQTNQDAVITKTGSAGIELFGDDVRLEQVLINYLTNAIKYSPDHKEVQLHVEVSPEQEIIVKVSDKGVGIPIEKQDKLFQKFFRVEDTSHRFQGLGIGLYICAEIIRRHNGTFGVVSEPGRGSTFYFSIPAAHQSKEQFVTSTS